jgi:peroxiredoxin
LADFQSHFEQFRRKDIALIAASVDSEEDARKTIERHGIQFQVGCGLNARAVAQTVGAFFDDEKGFLMPADFIINPEGKVYISTYSSGAIGRFRADECLEVINP